MNNSTPAKDIIYIDIDDEITAIIDKLRDSKSKIVALVLPKRATTLQSAVNMKLLKRAADEDKKHLVLITSEAGLMPLATASGIYVAKNLQSKPEIPQATHTPADDIADDAEEAVMLDDEPLNKRASVGELAARGAQGRVVSPSYDTAAGAKKENEAVAFDNTTTGNEAKVGGLDAQKPLSKKDKSLKVPNFGNFRKWLIIGGAGLVVLIFALYMALSVLPRGSITIKTDSQAFDTNVQLTLDPNADTVDTTNNTLPAQVQKAQKSYTQQATATGEQNNGKKAGGTVVMSAGSCTGTIPADVAAGTGITSNGLTFITQSTAKFEADTTSQPGKCVFRTTKSIAVTAQSPGAKYNVAPTTFSVAGRSGVTAESDDSMSGGTDDIQKILQQSDIDSAKDKIATQDSSAIKQQLKNELTSNGMFAVEATFTATDPAISSSAQAGAAVDSATVTAKVTYTMAGTKQSDLERLVKEAVKDEIDQQKQSILDYGTDSANFSAPSTSTGGSIATTMQTTVVAGPDIDTDALAKQVVGKKSGDAEKIIKAYPGVVDVTIHYSPFWVTSMPHGADQITIVIEKPQKTTNVQ
ncbi:MAG TPA: hypothetical protein VFI74_04700 [Candidatus Saccharimonadales bacterium]|nr:hypothetical protein [Candidatus Saccharimonadales bacterium]